MLIDIKEEPGVLDHINAPRMKRKKSSLRKNPIMLQRSNPTPTQNQPEFNLNGMTFCTLCKKIISRSTDLKRHFTKCHPEEPWQNHYNPTRFKDNSCPLCQSCFDIRSELISHMMEAHQYRNPRARRRPNQIEYEFFCEVCKKQFARKYDFDRHMKGAEHKPRQQTIEEKCKQTDSEGKVTYKCDSCELVFAELFLLKRHRSEHSSAFCCDICGLAMKTLTYLKRHVSAVHNQERPFPCSVCGVAFATKAALEDHMNRHTNSRPFVCEICGKGFRQRGSLYVHKMFHSDNLRFACEICGKKYRRKHDLKIHSYLHTGYKPLKCPKCEATFRLRHSLTKHLRKHDRQALKGLECGECGSFFRREMDLAVHVKIHVNGENVDAVT